MTSIIQWTLIVPTLLPHSSDLSNLCFWGPKPRIETPDKKMIQKIGPGKTLLKIWNSKCFLDFVNYNNQNLFTGCLFLLHKWWQTYIWGLNYHHTNYNSKTSSASWIKFSFVFSPFLFTQVPWLSLLSLLIFSPSTIKAHIWHLQRQ